MGRSGGRANRTAGNLPCCSSTWTASRRSTTPGAIYGAIAYWPRWAPPGGLCSARRPGGPLRRRRVHGPVGTAARRPRRGAGGRATARGDPDANGDRGPLAAVAASIGIAAAAVGQCPAAEELLRRADRAMYRAKSQGGGAAFFEEEEERGTL